MTKVFVHIYYRLSTIIVVMMALLHNAEASVPTEIFLAFSGNEHYVEIPYQSTLDLSVNAFSISAWIYPLSWGQNNQGRIVDHGGGSSGSSGWSLHIHNNSRALQAITFQINNDSSFANSSNDNVVQLNIWQHVAITYDNGTLTFYVNGVEQGILTAAPVPNPRVSPLRIGMRATDLLRGFDGNIDDVRIRNRALTPAEIQENMDIELSGTEPGLISYYRINSASGQTVLDGSPAGNDAVLGSTAGADLNDPTWVVTVNQPPVVDAGLDQIIVLPDNSVNLDAGVSDDGLPAATLITGWSVVSGPGSVTFADATMIDTSVMFSVEGVYQLRLQADDGELIAFDDITVTVDPISVLASITVQPNTLSLETGAAQLFTATGFDQGGNLFSISPVWTTTGGSIDAQGNYVAPASTGVYTVVATNGTVSGSSSVTVTDPSAYLWPTYGWAIVTPAEAGLQQTLLEQARDYALSGGGAGSIVKSGQQVFSWGSQTTLYHLKSTTKSFGAALTGLALSDGLVDLHQLAQQYLPGVGIPPQSNSDTGWLGLITLKYLLTHTAGFDVAGGYIDLLFQPGTVWLYTNGGANWLADVLTVTFNQDLNNVLFDRLLTPMGLSATDLSWRSNIYRTDTINGIKSREFGSGISANVDAMARFGYLFLRQGEWDGQQLLPADYVAELSVAAPSLAGLPVNLPQKYYTATDHYGYLWWNNADGTMPNVPKDAYWSWGLFESLIIVIPSLDIVVARAGGGWRKGWDADYSVIEPFLEPIVLATLGENYVITVDAVATVLDVLANDMVIGFEGETLTIINVSPASAGGIVNNLSTSLEYTPPAGFVGIETFDYTVQSSSGTIFTVTVTINVQAIIADGDLTDDGVVDVRDILRGYKIILGLALPDLAEIRRGDVAPLINGQPVSDGVFNLGDLLVIQRKVLGDIVF